MCEPIKLRVRNLSNTEHLIEVAPTTTIADVKAKVAEVFTNISSDPSRQTLIHLGKTLMDDQVIGDIPDIRAQNFIVVRSKAASASSTQSGVTPPPTASSTPAAPTQTDATQPGSLSDGAGVTAPSALSGGNTAEEGGATAMESTFGQQLETMVESIMTMGFSETATREALRAAYNCPARAVEYLITGVPRDATPAPTPNAVDSNVQDEAGDQGDIDPSINIGAQLESLVDPSTVARIEELAQAGNIEALRNEPVIERLRAQIQRGPEMLPHILTAVARAYPSLAHLITTHSQLLLDLIVADDSSGNESNTSVIGSNTGDIGMMNMPVLTDNDVEAIRRLQALGFSASNAAQAYIGCERNEEAAANYLFDNLADFEVDESNQGGAL